MAELDAVTLNARLLDGDRLLVTRAADGRVVGCTLEFLDDRSRSPCSTPTWQTG